MCSLVRLNLATCLAIAVATTIISDTTLHQVMTWINAYSWPFCFEIKKPGSNEDGAKINDCIFIRWGAWGCIHFHEYLKFLSIKYRLVHLKIFILFNQTQVQQWQMKFNNNEMTVLQEKMVKPKLRLAFWIKVMIGFCSYSYWTQDGHCIFYNKLNEKGEGA